MFTDAAIHTLSSFHAKRYQDVIKRETKRGRYVREKVLCGMWEGERRKEVNSVGECREREKKGGRGPRTCHP